MCANIGVDPLASNKGFWAELLGMNDFYYELGVQVADLCLSSRPQNGGLIDLSVLHSRLLRLRGSAVNKIGMEDICAAIKTLKVCECDEEKAWPVLCIGCVRRSPLHALFLPLSVSLCAAVPGRRLPHHSDGRSNVGRLRPD